MEVCFDMDRKRATALHSNSARPKWEPDGNRRVGRLASDAASFINAADIQVDGGAAQV
jgi:hypothetical protein